MFKSFTGEWPIEKPITAQSDSVMTCKNRLQNTKERGGYGEPLEREPRRDEASRGITTEQLVEMVHKHEGSCKNKLQTLTEDQIDTVASGRGRLSED